MIGLLRGNLSSINRSAALLLMPRKVLALGIVLGTMTFAAAPAAAAPVFDVKLGNDANEIQKVDVSASSGQFRLVFDGAATGDLAFDASLAQVQAALNALPTVADQGGAVTVATSSGFQGAYHVIFDLGPLANANVPLLAWEDGTVPLEGRRAQVSIATTVHNGVSRSDDRVDYTVKVKNTSSPSTGAVEVGDSLTCITGNWSNGATLSFEWRHGGQLIPGATGSTYTVAPSDAGLTIQCVVIGTNAVATTKFASLNPVVVNPQPGIEPPKATDPKNAASRPIVTGTGTAMRTCAAPANWTPGATFGFQWLRNGSAIAGASANTYAPSFEATGTGTWTSGSNQITVNTTTTGAYAIGQRTSGTGIPTGTTISAVDGNLLTLSTNTTAAGTGATLLAGSDAGVVLQCEVIGENAGGKTVGISNNNVVGTVPAPPNNLVGQTPSIGDPNLASGPITVTVVLPTGLGTSVYTPATGGEGWACIAEPALIGQAAKAVCTRSTGLAPGASFPSLNVAVALGSDAPSNSVVSATVAGGGALTPGLATSDLIINPLRPFAIEAFDAAARDEGGADFTPGGGHPFSAVSSFKFSLKRTLLGEFLVNKYRGIESPKHLDIDIPRGFVANALATPGPLCPGVEDVLRTPSTCPPGSIVGGISVETNLIDLADLPIYALEPEYGAPAQFAFGEAENLKSSYTFVPHLRADDGYAITLATNPAPISPSLKGVDATLCGFGVGTRLQGNVTKFDGCKEAGEPGANQIALATNPTRCDGPQPVTKLRVDTWENPTVTKTAEFQNAQITDCDDILFEPGADIQPVSSAADSPTGLDVELTMPTEGLIDPEGVSQANVKKVVVHFPQGMAINPAAASGLGACAADQVKLGTNDPISCPAASKIGTVSVETPLIRQTLGGSLYLGQQSEAEPGDLAPLYLVFESERDGIIIKVRGAAVVDPDTGQLSTVFDELPEQPFSRVTIKFAQGPRASLMTPPSCGSYEIQAELVPWTIADLDNPTPEETVGKTIPFAVTQGPDGSPCPDGRLDPKLTAGTADPAAGKTSPFLVRLQRDDGTQRFTALDLNPPQGLAAYLRGVPYCSDAALASVQSAKETGRAEMANPSCPAASQIGTAVVGAGAGPSPFYIDTGRVYLAGPYKGAPVSLAVVTPAVAGPVDLGSVVVRSGLYVNPVTTQISAVSDPIPTRLHGVLLDIRDVRIAIDRPDFTLNPTSCEPLSVGTAVKGDGGGSALLSAPFQARNCAALGFKPHLKLQLKGGTRRNKYQRLTATVTARPGDANIARAAVTLPGAIFLAQEHIRTVCTRVQFAADACPAASIYGYAEAVTPLLDEPLQGPVYLRSSDNVLPDLVAALRGPDRQPIEVELASRTDSKNGGIRNTFDFVPDAPVSTFTLRMKGGSKSLLVTSRNICQQKERATVKLRGQNGMLRNFRPLVQVDCPKPKQKKGK